LTRTMIAFLPVRKALCLLVFLVVIPGSGSAQQGTREVMADAMARMMEAMGLLDAAPPSRSSLMDPIGATQWGTMSGAPWGNPFGDRPHHPAMWDLMQQFSGRMTPRDGNRSDRPVVWEPSRLEGVWEGRDGELLIVQGSRFRIYSAAAQRVDGLMQIQGDRLALYNPLDGHAQPFELAESQGRLVMRDLAGQLYLYRRLRLHGSQGIETGIPPDY